MKNIIEEFDYLQKLISKRFNGNELKNINAGFYSFESICLDIFNNIDDVFKENHFPFLKAKTINNKSYLTVNIKVYPGNQCIVIVSRNDMKYQYTMELLEKIFSEKRGILYEHTYTIDKTTGPEYIPMSVVLVHKNREVLLLERAMKKDDGSIRHNGGKWEFVGGKVEEGESFTDCALRELSEEVCVSTVDDLVNIVDFKVYEYDYQNKFYGNVFTYEYNNELLILSSEHVDKRFTGINSPEEFLSFSKEEVNSYI